MWSGGGQAAQTLPSWGRMTLVLESQIRAGGRDLQN